METPIIAGLVGATVGASLSFLANWFLAHRKVSSDAKIERALEVLGYLSKTLNREGPDHLKGTVPKLRLEWAQHIRALYLLNISKPHRNDLDEKVTAYLDSLDEWDSKPERRTEVERRRELAKEAAFRFMRKLGL
jgi:hypothetical protein